MPIMSVLILVLNLYARSATESQVIILDLILSFISVHGPDIVNIHKEVVELVQQSSDPTDS